MERRDFIRKASGTAIGAAMVGGCSSQSSGTASADRPRVRWRLASSFPRSLDTIFGASEVLAKRVEELTDGKFSIRVYPAGEIVPGLQVLDGVQQANVDMGHSASYYYIGKNPALVFDTAVPFGLTARQQAAWMNAGGLELMREIFADFNIINFPGGNTGTQMGGWFRKPVNSLEELKGLKMRIPGLGGKVMSRLGVTVQVLAGGDIYPALERGAIDATEWVGPYDDQKLGFHKVAKNYYYPGWWEPGPQLSFYVNKTAYEALPAGYQAALATASAEASANMMAEYDAKNPIALQELLAEGVQLQRYPDEILDAAQKETQALMAEKAAKDPSYKKVFDHWDAFRKQSNQWFGTCEQAYSDFAFGDSIR